MHDIWMRIEGNMVDRVHGAINFRLILQPVMASIVAILSGVKDARHHKPPYLWAVLSGSGHRGEMIKGGWNDIGNVFIFALVFDVIYQAIAFRFVYSGEALIVGFLLTIAPYLILRGVVNRLASIKWFGTAGRLTRAGDKKGTDERRHG